VSTGHPAPTSVLIIGSGPVVIGQAAEFDYAGTQACRALRAEGIRTILVNSNPATIMTDPSVADAVYLEPLTVEVIERIIERERPDGLLAGLGGQTALNLAVALDDAGVFNRHPIRLLGTPLSAIRTAEDRELFRAMCDQIGQPVAPSAIIVGATPEARDAATAAALAEIGLPAIVRPAFTLGGTGGGIVTTRDEYFERVRSGLRASPIGQVMIERCLVGWQEIEYEVMRDAEGTCIAVCSMENVDPLGVHTGDSIVVAPVQTLPDPVHQRLRAASLDIIRALGVEGGCNVQLALSPDYIEYVVIEVNPRVSRSSALASKATGYPIARVAAQIAVGRSLREIPNAVTGTTVAAFEPALDYIVVKLPRFPFDKFPGADRLLGSQMKATGEVMAIDRTFGAALNKALRSMEQAGSGPTAEEPSWGGEIDAIVSKGGEDLARFLRPSDSRLWRLLAAMRRGVSVDEIHAATGITRWFLAEFARLIDIEGRVRVAGRTLIGPDPESISLLATAKRSSFGDADLARMGGVDEARITTRRAQLGLTPAYAMVDTCAAEFAAATPYFYSTFAAAGSPPEAGPVPRPAALVIGSGPVRIGQGIEFDYCAVRAAERLRERGWSAVMANSNPETVSTDFDASTRLYFEPLDAESIMEIVRVESPEGESTLPAFVQFGGQTPLNLAAPLAAAGVPLLGASLEAIDETEDRVRFAALLDRLGILQPAGGLARSAEEAVALAERVGYPVIVRPSYVIGGLAIDVAYAPEDLSRQLARIGAIEPGRPLRIDRFLEGIEIDIDAVSDGETVVIPGLLEHVELAGVHSGDSIAVYPPQRVSAEQQATVAETFVRLVRAIGVRGLVNAQFIVRDDGIYCIEVNPRASRTVPFMSKVTGIPLVALAVDIALGDLLATAGYESGVASAPVGVAVKAPAFSTAKLRGVDPTLGPFMQSTGEVIGIGTTVKVALGKALIAANLLPLKATAQRHVALLTIADRDKGLLGRLATPLVTAGYTLVATPGTQVALAALGISAAETQPLSNEPDGSPQIAELIRSGVVALVVNTPSPHSGALRDALEIRLAAVEEGVLCLTAMETAVAVAEAIAVRRDLDQVAIAPLGIGGLRVDDNPRRKD